MPSTSISGRSLLFLVGPTATGKTALALRLAKKLRGEIISADSMVIYKGMNIGTAKPNRSILKKIRHHLVDVIPPTQNYSVFQYRKEALRAIESILKKGKVPIVVGGSGWYVSALIDGLSSQPAGSNRLRKHYADLQERRGLVYLYKRLQRRDPKRAEAIHPNDQRRIFRALEILDRSGQLPSDWKDKRTSLSDLGYRFVVFGLTKERRALYQDIHTRIDQMLDQGWLKESKRLSKMRLSKTARQAVGYRELFEYLKGDYSWDETVSLIQRNTRHLAKKQWTWFRRDPAINWFEIKKSNDSQIIEKKMVQKWKKFISS